MNRYKDWLDQARLNLTHAEGSIEMGDYAWSCFAAQQAAESAAKALHLRHGQVAWGHSVLDLLTKLPVAVRPGPNILESARTLDKYYIPTRYPDAHPAGTAGRNYSASDAREAVMLAKKVVEYGESKSLET